MVIKLRFDFPAGCFLFRAWESILVGMIGSILTLVSLPFFDKMRIDDPVGMLNLWIIFDCAYKGLKSKVWNWLNREWIEYAKSQMKISKRAQNNFQPNLKAIDRNFLFIFAWFIIKNLQLSIQIVIAKPFSFASGAIAVHGVSGIWGNIRYF